MHTSHQLIELAKQRLALKHRLELPMTDYRLAKLMGFRQATVSSWRTGKTRIGTEFAARFAEACELPEAYVYACVQMERATDPSEKSILREIAKAFKGRAAAWIASAILATGMLFASPSNVQANQIVATTSYSEFFAGRTIDYIDLDWHWHCSVSGGYAMPSQT